MQTIRSSHSLNGLWQFAFLGDVDPIGLDVCGIAFNPGKVLVPSAFDALPDLAGKRGVAAYATTFRVSPGSKSRLRFGAVSMWSAIYVDGCLLTEHHNGYAPFDLLVPVAEHEERELVVLVDNRYNFTRTPMHEEFFDFYQYGGILREIKLESLPATDFCIDYAHFLPTANYRLGEVEVRVGLIGNNLPAIGEIRLSFDGEVEQTFSDVPVDGNEMRFLAKVPNPRIWSLTNPAMHSAAIALQGTDAIAVRFGLRRIETHGAKLWLNEEELQIRGYNRHEWHPNFGPCTPLAQMYNDLVLMKAMGCNFVRGCHYPQDQQFLDLCDELGMLVWEENLGWGQKEKTFKHPDFEAHHERSLRNMVKWSANHPCVIVWGFMNEAETQHAFTRGFWERTIATLRSLDSSRLVTWASNHPLDDVNYDLVDFIALNIYPGWYGCAGESNPIGMIEPFWHKCIASIDGRGFTDKAIIISETGVEGLYGWRDPAQRFSLPRTFRPPISRRYVNWRQRFRDYPALRFGISAMPELTAVVMHWVAHVLLTTKVPSTSIVDPN
ncbi:MAG: beta-galactosidase [Verrucomicrobia bacterium]|nr:beta-galactosidase [Verrucomicrobiota bacterium]